MYRTLVLYCSLRHINISLIFNSLISQCNPGVSEYLFNIDLIEFSTLRRRLEHLPCLMQTLSKGYTRRAAHLPRRAHDDGKVGSFHCYIG